MQLDEVEVVSELRSVCEVPFQNRVEQHHVQCLLRTEKGNSWLVSLISLCNRSHPVSVHAVADFMQYFRFETLNSNPQV